MPFRHQDRSTEARERAARPRRWDGTVVSGFSEWDLNDDEACGLRQDILDEMGAETGANILVTNRENNVQNAFHVRYSFDETDTYPIRMGAASRDRFYADTTTTPSSFSASWARQIPDPQITRESVADNVGANLETYRLDPTDDVVIMAPHGGFVETYTAEIAQRVADRLDTSLWTAEGNTNADDRHGNFSKWHLTSTTIDPGAWSGLGAADEVGNSSWPLAVSIHGFSETDIAVGGTIPLEDRRTVADSFNANGDIAPTAIAVGPDGDGDGSYSNYWGNDATNFINWVSAPSGGLQLEFPSGIRSSTDWRTTAQATVDALELIT